MVTFETIQEHELEFNERNFALVALKEARDDQGSTPFIQVARGYFTDPEDKERTRRYKSSVTLPPTKEIIDHLRDSLDGIEETLLAEEILP